MNLSDFVTVADELVSDNTRLKIDSLLTAFENAAASVSSQPSEPTFHQAFVDAEKKLRMALNQLYKDFNPGTPQRIAEIGADRWFTAAFLEEIKDIVAENAMTPSIVSAKISEIRTERASYVSHLETTLENLVAFGVEAISLEEGQALGRFVIPREIFLNSFNGLIGELKTMLQLIDTLNEVKLGETRTTELISLSTTDPQIVISIPPITAALLGGLTMWAIGLWDKVLQTKKIGAEIKNLNADTAKKISDILKADVDEMIETGLKEKIAELVGVRPQGRKAELRTSLTRLLKWLLARVERGMIVTIDARPFAKDKEEHVEENKAIDNVNDIGRSIPVRIASFEPMLELESGLETQ